MRLDFQGRVAAVTGGASGIGRAVAARLAGGGALVALLDRDEITLERTAAELRSTPVIIDVAVKAEWTRAIERIEAELGPVDVLVTAAGILDPPRPPERASEKSWEKTFAVNFVGTRIACQTVGAGMAARGRVSIITIASIAAFEPGPLVVYGPAKAAVIALTRALAGAWGRHGVRVNAVAPGYVRTPALERGVAFRVVDEQQLIASTALGRLATAEEVAAAAAFLASDAAAAITGIVLPVDAGHLLAGGWAPHGGFSDPESWAATT